MMTQIVDGTELYQRAIAEIERIRAEKSELRKALHMAVHTVRSYQYGNSSPDLADEFVGYASRLLNETMPATATDPDDERNRT